MLRTRNYSLTGQYLISLVVVAVVAVPCWFVSDIIGYRAVALILLMAVSVNAILFDIYPLLVSALLSALVWNFFFIPPTFTLQIGNAEDGLMLMMYFVIATLNGVLTHAIRKAEREARDREEKEEAIALYNTILHSLSHELRTPIAAIIGAVDTIRAGHHKPGSGQVDELLAEIELAGMRLNRQVENLLHASRLESGTISPKEDWCDLNEVVFGVIHDAGDAAARHHISFAPTDALPPAKMDGGLLVVILYNLVHNALRHTPPGTAIDIATTRTATGCAVTVTDNGPGIDEREKDRIFDKFFRSGQSLAGGTGLGLSIVRGFAEAMHGTATAENMPEGGARFTVEIPCLWSAYIPHEHD